MIDNLTVGKTIAALRQQANLSQQGLANLCSVTHQAVSKWENGMALPDMQTMLFLSKYFEVSMEDILMGRLPAGLEQTKKKDEMSAEAPEQQTSPMDKNEEKMAEAEAWQEDHPEMPEQAEKPDPCDSVDEIDPMDSAPAMDWKEIVHLAPFASTQTIDQLLMTKIHQGDGETLDWNCLSHLIAFASSQVVDRLLEETLSRPDVELTWKKARRFLPFAGRETIEKIFSRFLKEMDTHALTEIAPFVSGQFLARALRDMGDRVDVNQAIHHLLPFLPTGMVDELIQRKMNQPAQESTTRPQTVSPNRADIQKATIPMDGEKRASSQGERPLMRIARKAVADGNEDWLEEHGGELTGPELAILVPLAVEKGLWGALEELWEQMEPQQLDGIVDAALRDGKWGILEEMQEHVEGKTLEKIVQGAIQASRWDLLEELMNQADDVLIQKTAQAAIQEGQWDLLEGLLDQMNSDTLQKALDAAIAASNWDMIDQISEYLE